MNNKVIISICIVGFMLISSGGAINAERNNHIHTLIDFISGNLDYGIINITAQEAYDMLTDKSDGIQIPIDIRYIHEWKAERIDTPIPENSRWYLWDLLKNDNITNFLYQYEDCEIIIYCKGGYRSWRGANSIDAAGFTGIIYNMVGGITAWKNAGLPTSPGGVYNITVYEAWELLNDTLNGKQIPIDVRSKEEWKGGFIDTPYPEHPRLFLLDWIKNDSIRPQFMADYIGKELINYCKGGYRSLIASYELYYDNFTGTLYNMLGGITAWEAAGFPIRIATPPIVNIDGPQKAKHEINVTFTFNVTDDEEDVFWLLVNWGDGCPSVNWTGPIAYGQSVQINHSFAEKKIYNVSAKARDPYNVSDWAYFEIHIPKNQNIWYIEWLNRFQILQRILDVLRLNIR